MFIVFNGKGWLVPITGLAAIVACGVSGARDPVIVWSAFGLSGLLDHYLGRKWNNVEGRLVQDLTTGEITEVKPDHSFFWIPMQYWLYIKFVLCAICIAIALEHRS
jgi:hypothetical protein